MVPTTQWKVISSNICVNALKFFSWIAISSFTIDNILSILSELAACASAMFDSLAFIMASKYLQSWTPMNWISRDSAFKTPPPALTQGERGSHSLGHRGRLWVGKTGASGKRRRRRRRREEKDWGEKSPWGRWLGVRLIVVSQFNFNLRPISERP